METLTLLGKGFLGRQSDLSHELGFLGLHDFFRSRGLKPWKRSDVLRILKTTAEFAWLLQPRPLISRGHLTLVNTASASQNLRNKIGNLAAQKSWGILPLSSEELSSLIPQDRVLICSRFPEVSLHALSNAARVLSTHPDVVRAALAMGTPAAWIVNSIQRCVLPQLVWSDAGDWSDGIDSLLCKIDWDSIRREKEKVAARAIENFGRFQAVKKDRGKTVSVCCMASRDYLPQFAGFVENLNRVTAGRCKLYFLAFDDISRRFANDRYGPLLKHSYSLSDLWKKKELQVLKRRSVAQNAYASKSRLILRAIADGARETIYSDLDIFFFRSPTPFRLFQKASCAALLFPHWNRSFSDARNHGIFNAGMIAANEKARSFLEWWGRLCLQACEKNSATGHYDDQAYLDLAVSCFPNVRSYPWGDENLGNWNFETLGARFSENTPGEIMLRSGRVVGSLHTPQDDDEGFFEVKYAWDQMIGLIGAIPLSRSSHHNVWLIQRRYFSEVHRLHQIYEAVGNRLGRKGIHLPERWERFLVGSASGVTVPWTPIRQLWRSGIGSRGGVESKGFYKKKIRGYSGLSALGYRPE